MIKMVLKIFIRSRIELMFYLNVYEELKTSRFHNINFLEYKKKLEEEKKILKTGHNQDELLKIWFIQTAIEIIEQYYECFSLLKKRSYQKAWNILEKIEISFINIKFNNISYSDCPVLVYIEKYTYMLQKLYPYKIFASPEMLHKKVVCSVCGKTMIPFSDCLHIAGKVYDGEMCYGIVKELDFINVAMVTKPNQKYSVCFQDIENPKRYKVLEYIIPKLKSEFIQWTYNIYTDYEPYSNYKIGRNDLCPCGSGKKFKRCCLLNNQGIAYPHYEFTLP